jgi:hypothetical protein
MTLKYPNNKLTVVFRDDSPFVHFGDCPAYRSVSITLTDEQVRALAMRRTHGTSTVQYYEAISRCFIEPHDVEPNAEVGGPC